MTELSKPQRDTVVAEWWKARDVFASSLVALFIDRYGEAALNWDPDTIAMELHADFGDIPESNTDKLMAMITALTTDTFYRSPEVFMSVCMALNGDADTQGWDSDLPDIPEAEELAWGITEVALLDAQGKHQELRGRFSDEIRRLIGVVLAGEGIDNPPDVLSIADMPPTPEKGPSETFADDPQMFSGINQSKFEARKAVSRYVAARSQALIAQLAHLPLARRDRQSWQGFVDRYRQGRSSVTTPASRRPAEQPSSR